MHQRMSARFNSLFCLIGASIDSRDIVDRHRERTLALLWKIVFAFQVLFSYFVVVYKLAIMKTLVFQEYLLSVKASTNHILHCVMIHVVRSKCHANLT